MTNWQQLLAAGASTPQVLLELLGLPPDTVSHNAHLAFNTRVPRGFIARMEYGNRYCPLLLQVLPVAEELSENPGYTLDPLNEQAYNPVPGLLHKYHGRILLTFTGSCAINCRYCFRRHFPYTNNQPKQNNWEDVLRYIANDTTITEVILSGGDPLIANDDYLAAFIQKLEAISHVATLRIHTRLPIVLPERVTPALITCLTRTRLTPVVVLHCNHPNEVDTSVKQALQRLKENRILILNQSVLLKNINDDHDTLIQLSRVLFSAGVLPYYLHMLDKVQGAQHFEVSLEKANCLHQMMLQSLPGYLVPKLVKEEAGASHKIPL